MRSSRSNNGGNTRPGSDARLLHVVRSCAVVAIVIIIIIIMHPSRPRERYKRLIPSPHATSKATLWCVGTTPIAFSMGAVPSSSATADGSGGARSISLSL